MEMDRKKKWIRAGLFGAVGLLVVVLAIFFFRKPALEITVSGGKVLTPAVEIPQFSLIDHQGRPFNNDRLKGHWTLAMTGFTYCPDVCPTTLSIVAAFFTKLEALPKNSNPPRFVFLSVDPFRDTIEELGRYVAYFSQDFIGVTGTPEHINQLVTELGLYYVYTDPDDDHFLDDILHKPAKEDYGVVHSARVLFINPQGELVALLSQPFEADDLLTMFTELRSYYGD
jgi:protein SCO1